MTILKFVFQNQKQSIVSNGNVQCVICEHFTLFVQTLILDTQVMHPRNKSKMSNNCKFKLIKNNSIFDKLIKTK